MTRPATRTARMELRADPEREERIRLAAELERQSVSAFVLDAAAERAEQVIAAAEQTPVPPAFFDALWESLDGPPRLNPALERQAAKRRRVKQR